MAQKAPSVIVTFKERGITAIQRSQRGILAMILTETQPLDPLTIYSVDDIPESGLSADNVEQIQLALKGYQTSPRKILVYTVENTTYTDILKSLENVRFDWLVIPGISAENAETVASWIKSMRTVKDKAVKAVLPNEDADFEGVVNFTNTSLQTKSKTYTAAQYCSRVAGIICGTPMTISCTYAPAPELIACDSYTSDERDEKVGKGELFFFNDGEKIKICKGVNSYVTTVQGKLNSYQKIKLVDLMDMIHDDIKQTGHDSYIGKYANSYDNRCLLVTAINGYFHELEKEGLLEVGQNLAEIDIEATKNWLEANGKYTRDELESMTDLAIKKANIGENVFIKSTISMLDAIEHIEVANVIQ